MIVTSFTRAELALRRERRRFRRLGYRYHETDWEIIRGDRTDEHIIYVQISANGKGVWTKLGPGKPVCDCAWSTYGGHEPGCPTLGE